MRERIKPFAEGDSDATSGGETRLIPAPRTHGLERRASVEDRRRSGREQEHPRVSVIIPALNEEQNLPHVLRRLPPVFEVVLVDGGSRDDTIAVARRHRPDISVVRQTRPGKGNALACGFAASRGDIIVMLDADGSADPREIPRFVAALTTGADFAKGSRFASGAGSSDITPLRRMGNRSLGALVNRLYGTHYTDLCYGYNAFWRRCLDHLDLPSIAEQALPGRRLWGDGFEIETLINVRVARAGLTIYEVPSFEFRRIFGNSNLQTFRDGVRVLRTIITEHTRHGSTGRRNAQVINLVDRCELHDAAVPCCVRIAQ